MAAVMRRRPQALNDNAIVLSRDAGKQQWLVEPAPVSRASESTPLLPRSPAPASSLARAPQANLWLQDLLLALQRGFEYIFAVTGCATAPIAPIVPLDDVTLRALSRWNERIRSSPYDASNLVHEQQLMELWRRAFPDEPLEQRVTKQWGKLGFQGKDPATDFRGAGIYSLTNLLHLSERYQRFFGSLVASSFPFAITSINLTNVLFELLGYGMRPSPHSHSRTRLCSLVVADGQVRDDLFCEAYCLIFWCFAEEWRRMNATYLQFPTVMTAARMKFCLLIEEIRTPADLAARNARAFDADLIRF